MRILSILLCLLLVPLPANAIQIEAPIVPEEYRDWMPEDTSSFSKGIGELLRKTVDTLMPDIREAFQISMGLMAAVLLVSSVHILSGVGQMAAETAGTVAVAAMLLGSTGSMICLGADMVRQIGEYGKLLLPVMTTALAAQGGITASGTLYAGTALFTALLQSAIDSVLVPGIYLYLVMSVGSAATSEGMLKRIGDLLKQLIGWSLKILLIVFTTYLSLSRVVTGTTDAAALKAAKVSMSSFVPVVGGVLSDASEAVLVGAGLMKNAAGIYGILAVLALFLYPFARIGVQYLVLKLTAAVCSIFGTRRMTDLIDCFGNAMALLLAMTGAGCVMVLISTVCFMKGVG